MTEFEHEDENCAALRIRCVRQITDADAETLQIVSAVLTRVIPGPQVVRRKKRNAIEATTGKGSAE
jgi:hypothetical protein